MVVDVVVDVVDDVQSNSSGAKDVLARVTPARSIAIDKLNPTYDRVPAHEIVILFGVAGAQI